MTLNKDNTVNTVSSKQITEITGCQSSEGLRNWTMIYDEGFEV